MSERKPSALFYLLPAFLIAVSAVFFAGKLKARKAQINDTIAHYQRFVAPSAGQVVEGGLRPAAVLELPAGSHTVFYESFGTFDGESFDTPARQLWPVKDRPSMTLTVTRDDGADKGQRIEVMPAGFEADPKLQARIEKNPRGSMPKNRGLVVYRRSGCGRDGHGMWLVDIPAAGFYRFETRYVPGVLRDAGAIVVPPELTKAQKKARFGHAYEEEAYERSRRQQMDDRALAQVRPMPVLFAVGRDPLGQTLFNPTSLYGAAGFCAFMLTAGVGGAALVWALRSRQA